MLADMQKSLPPRPITNTTANGKFGFTPEAALEESKIFYNVSTLLMSLEAQIRLNNQRCQLPGVTDKPFIGDDHLWTTIAALGMASTMFRELAECVAEEYDIPTSEFAEQRRAADTIKSLTAVTDALIAAVTKKKT